MEGRAEAHAVIEHDMRIISYACGILVAHKCVLRRARDMCATKIRLLCIAPPLHICIRMFPLFYSYM